MKQSTSLANTYRHTIMAGRPHKYHYKPQCFTHMSQNTYSPPPPTPLCPLFFLSYAVFFDIRTITGGQTWGRELKKTQPLTDALQNDMNTNQSVDFATKISFCSSLSLYGILINVDVVAKNTMLVYLSFICQSENLRKKWQTLYIFVTATEVASFLESKTSPPPFQLKHKI